MRKSECYWASNPEWYHFENGIVVLNESAPPEAKESFKIYLEQNEKSEKKVKDGKSLD